MTKSKKIKIGKINLEKKKLILIGVIALILIASLVIGISLLSKEKEEPKNEPVKVEEEEPIVEETKKLQIIDEDSKTRPYAIVINNISVARPLQSGLQDAYIIYEFIAEGGVTRYLALFMDKKTERIGSIRSARHYFLDYALENDAIFVHHGQSPQAKADFSNLNIDRIEVSENKTGWRDKDLRKQGIASEHTLFTSMEKLANGIGSKRTTSQKDLLLNYSIDSLDLKNIPNSKEANNISIKYSNSTTSSYEYDANTKTYKRFVNGKAHTDYVTKQNYTFKNIITYQVGNYTLNDGENKGRQELENTGSGNGYFISEGFAIPITWKKSSRDSQTKYYYEDGQELKVNDGNTFIQIQPKGMTLNIS